MSSSGTVFKEVPLIEVAPLVCERVEPFEGQREYLPTGGVEGASVVSTQPVTYKDRPSRADFTVRSGEVAYARMKATSKVVHITRENAGLILSTGFAVHRPIPDFLEGRYLYHFLLAPQFQSLKDKHCSGATQKAVTNSSIGSLRIPIPCPEDRIRSLEIQKRVAYILDRAGELVERRQESIGLCRQLIESSYLELFGDCLLNGKGFRTSTLEKLTGRVVDCPHNTPQYTSLRTEHLCVRSSDIQEGYLDLRNARCVSADVYNQRIARHMPQEGEIVYTREGGRLGNAAQIPGGARVCLGQRMMLFSAKPKVSTNEFIWALLNSPGIRHQVNGLVAGAAAPRINIGDMRRLKVIVPPLALQERFSDIVRSVRDQRTRLQLADKDAAALYSRLGQDGFQRVL